MTLAEMRQRMTDRELNIWQRYASRFGPLPLALRIEAAVARVAAPFFKGVTPADFMPWPVEDAGDAATEDDDGTGMESITAAEALARGWRVVTL